MGHLREDMFANTGRTRLWEVPLAWLQSPGFAVITYWRLAVRLSRFGAVGKVMAAVVWRFGVAGNGCHISLEAGIGARPYFPHATGIVVGRGVQLGSDVTIYQNVTVGQIRDGVGGYPRIEDGCVLYSGCTVVGGVTVGTKAKVGAGSFVRGDIPAGAVAVGAPARVVSPPAP